MISIRVVSNGRAALLRRAYTVAVENVKAQPIASSVIGKAVDPTRIIGDAEPIVKKVVEKEVYWMKDPKTGNWIPESHFDEIDIVELREKFLSPRRNIA